MRKYYLFVVLIAVAILACTEKNTSNKNGDKTVQKSNRKRISKDNLKVIDESELLKGLDITLPEGLLLTGANQMVNVYHSQFESTRTLDETYNGLKKILDDKIGTTFLRVESKNKKFEPWDLREVGPTTMRAALYIYKNGQDALNVKIASNKNRGGVLVYLGKAKIYN